MRIEINCTSITFSNAIWPAAEGGETVTGECLDGFYSSSPERSCQKSGGVGVWESVSNPCQRSFLLSFSFFLSFLLLPFVPIPFSKT